MRPHLQDDANCQCVDCSRDGPGEVVVAVGEAMYPKERQTVQMAIIRAMTEWRCWADYVDCAYALINVTRQANSLRDEHNHHLQAEAGGAPESEPSPMGEKSASLNQKNEAVKILRRIVNSSLSRGDESRVDPTHILEGKSILRRMDDYGGGDE